MGRWWSCWSGSACVCAVAAKTKVESTPGVSRSTVVQGVWHTRGLSRSHRVDQGEPLAFVSSFGGRGVSSGRVVRRCGAYSWAYLAGGL
eukprot:2201924-Prymnesium_polylepis.1